MSIDRILKVPYNLPGSSSWQWVNIYTRMSQDRIIFLDRPITDGLANSMVSSLLYLESVDNTKPIYLYINSLGDPVAAGMANMDAGMMSVMAGLAIYDTIKHIKSEVYTICLGQAMGIATLLLAAGSPGKRASLPHAKIGLLESSESKYSIYATIALAIFASTSSNMKIIRSRNSRS